MQMAVSSPAVIISLSALAFGTFCCVLVCCRKRCNTNCGKFLGQKASDAEADGALDYTAVNRARFASIKHETERRRSIKEVNGNVLTTISRNQSTPILERRPPSQTFERKDSAYNAGQRRRSLRGEMERRQSIKVPKHLEKIGLPTRDVAARLSRRRMRKSMTTNALGNMSNLDRSLSEKRQKMRSRSFSVDSGVIRGRNTFSISNQTKPIQLQVPIPWERMRNSCRGRPLPARPRRASDSGEHAHQKYISIKSLNDSCFNYEAIPPARSVSDIYSPPMFSDIVFGNHPNVHYY